MAYRKKYKALILKYKPYILKYMPYIFRLSGCLKHSDLQKPQKSPQNRVGKGWNFPSVRDRKQYVDGWGRHKENARRNDVVHCCRAVCRGWQAVCGLQAFQEVFQNNGCRNFAVGCFGNDERCGSFDNVIAHNHVAAHGQTVHEVCVVGYCHVF